VPTDIFPVKNADHSCDWPVCNPNFLPTLQRMTDFLKRAKVYQIRILKKLKK